MPNELERAFRAYQAMVFRTAYRITGNAADAEDVLQSVFLSLLRRRPNTALQNEEAYFRRAAINDALDLLRSRQSERRVDLQESHVGSAPDDPRELRDALRRALARLQPRSAEVFSLRFLEGFTNQQIARMLGISQVFVAVIVYRARQQLRNELAAYSGDRS